MVSGVAGAPFSVAEILFGFTTLVVPASVTVVENPSAKPVAAPTSAKLAGMVVILILSTSWYWLEPPVRPANTSRPGLGKYALAL
jgi:hypothetical protein